MKKVAGQVILALVLVGLGGAFWVAGRLEGRVADAHEELALLRYTALDAEYGDIDQAMPFVRRVPWVADGLVDDVEEHRAASEYWRAHYDALAPKRDASGAVIDQQPAVLAMAANAAYRTGQREGSDRQAVLRRLDTAIKSYAELLKKAPNNADAAYNYEYLVRLRETTSKTKPVPAGKREDPAKLLKQLTGLVMAGDLPDGKTVHGDPGSPPPNTDMTQFKMHIPVRPDERQGGSDAGQGKEKIRKG
jgi:tetratricopeptide (TPR) repeat protein